MEPNDRLIPSASPPPGVRLACSIEHLWDGEHAGYVGPPRVMIDVEVDGVRLRIDAPWHGDAPPTGPPGRKARLWEHEVVECMVLGEDDRYLEVEIGPHGHWLVLQLEGVRRVIAEPEGLVVEVDHAGARWRADAWIPNGWLPPGWSRWNAFAIHGEGPARRYAAWRPAGGEAPDFHRLEVFAPWQESVTADAASPRSAPFSGRG